MTNFAYAAIGEMLIGLGKSLQDPESSLRKNFKLSSEQLSTLIGVIRIAASPSVQKKYIYNLTQRWGVDQRTIHNWVKRGLIRPGYKSAYDTRLWWLANELDEDEKTLIKLGYIKPRRNHRIRYFVEMINGIFNL